MSQGTDGRYHEPVMVNEVVELFLPLTEGVVIDATFGGGGHAAALLRDLADGIEVIGIDRDPDALANADRHDRLTLAEGNFGDIDVILDKLGIGRITGALFDLGVSSHQLDVAERGFSFRASGPLDMRMGPDTSATAEDLVNDLPVAELARIIGRFGEERFAGRVARAIVAARPIRTTEQLADIVKNAIPAATRRTGGHPARRTFQALRIAVNDELTAVEDGVGAALDRLAPGGRCAVISYHSLEDRIVKNLFRSRTERDIPPGLPVEPEPAPFRNLTRRGLVPTEAEIAANPRARSARLRAIERDAA